VIDSGEFRKSAAAYPSVPVPEMSQQPAYEIRYAEIGDPPVGIWYRRTYETDIVDLFGVRRVSDTGWGDIGIV
jgi:hypothetical protein